MHRILLLLITAAAITSAHAQWTEPVRIGIPGAYYYPQILACGDTLHVVGTHIPGGDKVVYLRSDDAGDSWGESHVLSDTVNSTNAMYARIVKNGQNIMVLWRSIMNQGPGPWNIGYALSDDNGETWTEPLYVLNPGWGHISHFGSSGSGSIVNVVVSRHIGYDLFFYSTRSANFGQSWSEPVELFRAAQSSLTDQAGINEMVHYVWGGRFDMQSKWETYYMRSTDEGISWSENSPLSEEDEYHSYSPSIWTDSQGNLVSTWFDYKYSPYFLTGDILLRQSPDSGSLWLPERQISYNHLAMGLSDVVCSRDTINIVWEDLGEGLDGRSIYYSRSIDYGSEWSEPYWIDGTDDDSWNPAMAASSGRVYVVWAEGSEESGFGLNFSRYEDETGISDEGPTMPIIAALRAYPNPFNSNVNVSVIMEKGGKAEIAIYDVSGRLVKTIFKGGRLERGTHKFTWDAMDARGKAVSSGLYFAVASTPQGKINKTLTLIR